MPVVRPTPLIPRGRKPLGNASPEEVGQAAVAFAYEERRVVSGTPQVLLTRPVTLEQLGEQGLGWSNFGSIEEPPLMLVILKGDFSDEVNFFSLAPSTGPSAEHYSYLGYVYDLWAGMPTIYLQSKSGGIFKNVLNDPSLPYEAPLSTPQGKAAVIIGHKVIHYGGMAIGEPVADTTVRTARLGALSYSAYKGVTNQRNADDQPADPAQIYATVSWSWDAPSGGQDYVAANKQALPQVAAQGGQVEVWMVFKDYVPVDQFRTFVQTHGLKPGLSYLRAIDESAKPVYAPYYTIKVNAAAGSADPISQAALDSQLANLQNDPQKQINLKGVYLTHAWVDAKQLTALAADPSVYYVDVSANLVRSDLAKAGVAGAQQATVIAYPELIFNSLVEKPYQSR